MDSRTDDEETDVYEFTERWGRPELIVHHSAPGLPTRVLTFCGIMLDKLQKADETEAGLTERICVVCDAAEGESVRTIRDVLEDQAGALDLEDES